MAGAEFFVGSQLARLVGRETCNLYHAMRRRGIEVRKVDNELKRLLLRQNLADRGAKTATLVDLVSASAFLDEIVEKLETQRKRTRTETDRPSRDDVLDLLHFALETQRSRKMKKVSRLHFCFFFFFFQSQIDSLRSMNSSGLEKVILLHECIGGQKKADCAGCSVIDFLLTPTESQVLALVLAHGSLALQERPELVASAFGLSLKGAGFFCFSMQEGTDTRVVLVGSLLVSSKLPPCLHRLAIGFWNDSELLETSVHSLHLPFPNDAPSEPWIRKCTVRHRLFRNRELLINFFMDGSGRPRWAFVVVKKAKQSRSLLKCSFTFSKDDGLRLLRQSNRTGCNLRYSKPAR